VYGSFAPDPYTADAHLGVCLAPVDLAAVLKGRSLDGLVAVHQCYMVLLMLTTR
jgi:hypothetical protein